MKIKTFYPFFFLAVLLLSFSCKKDIVLTGIIEGKVDLLTDEAGDTLSLRGIKVALISPLYDTAYATTDANGNYKFSDAKTGSYEVIIGESPIGQYHYFFKLIGGETSYYLPSVKLAYKSRIVPYDYKPLTDDYFSVKVKRPENFSGKSVGIVVYFYSNLNRIVFKEEYEIGKDYELVDYYHQGYKRIEIYGVAIREHSSYIDTLGQEIDPTLSTEFLTIKL